jgi:hypothetical protein
MIRSCGPGASHHPRPPHDATGEVNIPGASETVGEMTSEIRAGLAQAMIEQAADAIIFADVHGVIQVWNRAAVLALHSGMELEATGRRGADYWVSSGYRCPGRILPSERPFR